mgnify:CR=1 FL=1
MTPAKLGALCIPAVNLDEIIKELSNRDLLTNTKSNGVIIAENLENVKMILTMGIPEDHLECRECLEFLPATQFSFYQGRVDKNGYLMRSNAICITCTKKINNGRSEVFKNSKKKSSKFEMTFYSFSLHFPFIERG